MKHGPYLKSLLSQVGELCRLLAQEDGVFDAQPGRRLRSNASSPSVQARIIMCRWKTHASEVPVQCQLQLSCNSPDEENMQLADSS